MKRRSRELSSQMAATILKHERAEKLENRQRTYPATISTCSTSSPAILCRGDLCYSVFFLFFKPSPSFWQSFEPDASSVLIISHCVPSFVVPNVLGIDLSDEKTVSYSFFRSPRIP